MGFKFQKLTIPYEFKKALPKRKIKKMKFTKKKKIKKSTDKWLSL